ncbi:GNAT family N-acetyltransferase [Sphingomonas sp.]|uniref:GNAT family N-acetyltransferase n=1 Tax=Sphingomonas sp. TaxID=28214 RepID=UPI003CC5AB80
MIDTPRLRLRAWREADKADFAAVVNTPAMMRHFGGVKPRTDIDPLIDQQIASQTADGCSMWAVTLHDGTLAGICGVRWQRLYRGLPVFGELEIGWRVGERWWGQGIAREAAAASIDWAWANSDAPRVAAWTSAGNTRSWGLMKRLGMHRLPALDFRHPKVAAGDPDGAMIVYAIDRPA